VTKIIDSFRGDYRWLSNFGDARVVYDGYEFRSSENAYQAAKTMDLFERKIFQRITPGEAKRRGKEVLLRPDWDQVKLPIMYQILVDKFTRNLHLARQLLETRDAILVEGNDWGDTFWGVCNGHGYNHLGNCLMAVRSLLSDARKMNLTEAPNESGG
jgi:ribA/ribD-fused uncharacterized protein